MGGHDFGSDRLEINLMPLLDLVLQLIMFFIITVNFVRTEHNNLVRLPIVESAVPLDQTAHNLVFVNITKEGKTVVSSGENVETHSKLRAFLQREKETIDRTAREQGITDAKSVIVLRIDRDVHYRDMWDILDICSRAGYSGWQMRVERGKKN